eukprot:CAMPEP_0196822700 /NCGR_PEP_ID=MMETSP1362-20130617/84430_1 /TAXON_ID=163516 /ORGANISM="Leptocylindrus danicus, Strain CCMP1856" /LENGTH=490 /DNA_ID=CAMNT_0042202323 /DNA_START=167 /DNA_END=1639 /DNA_ORIENTATION=-
MTIKTSNSTCTMQSTGRLEGWLNKKSSSVLSVPAWKRRWFILNENGLYYLTRRRSSSASDPKKTEKTYKKVCDILLCTVRDVPGKNFMFEILGPNMSRSYMLKASDALEYRSWVDAIRCLIGQQLGDAEAVQGIMSIFDDHDHDDEDEDEDDIEELCAIDDNIISSCGISTEDQPPSPTRSKRNGKKRMSSSPSSHRLSTKKHPLLSEIINSNPKCADCGADNPEWLSLNLGVILCIECGGVHRSLGTHVSKVRSLNLDILSDAEYRLMFALGNEIVNRVMEAGIAEDFVRQAKVVVEKPGPSETMKNKEKYIRAKYIDRAFVLGIEQYVDPAEATSMTAFDKYTYSCMDLYEAARMGNITAAYEALAQGGNPNWVNMLDGHKSCLHICATNAGSVILEEGESVASGEHNQQITKLYPEISSARIDENELWEPIETLLSGNTQMRWIECAEFLLLNGANRQALDSDQLSPLQAAIKVHACGDMIEYLSKR